MVDLAIEAFSSRNFELAAEIYQAEIKQKASANDSNLYMGLADSYGRSGDLRRAFQAYSTAFKLGNVTTDQLGHLVTSLVDMMNSNEEFQQQTRPEDTEDQEEGDPFGCLICKSLWDEPITIECGHTFCRKCLEQETSRTCRTCGFVHRFQARRASLKANVLLQSTAQKWFPGEVAAVKFKWKGNDFFSGERFQEAISLYDEAFARAPTDHRIISNRSYAYASLQRYSEALQDAERVVKLQPDWPKGYYRRGVAYSGLRRHEEAAFAYLQCLTLDPSVTSARAALAKELHKILSPVPVEDLQHAEYQLLFNPNISLAMGAQCGLESLVPKIGVDTLQRAKASLRRSLDNSSHSQEQNTTEPQPCATSHADRDASSDQFDFSEAAVRERSYSLPSTPKSSQVQITRQHRAGSENDTSTLLSLETRLSRKRHGYELVPGPASPSRSVPKKLAREEQPKDKRYVPTELLNRDDFECSLCYRLLFHPVTTPCGHVFCRECLYRCLDHNSTCPLCKTSLVEYLAERRQATTEAVEKILQKYFPSEYAERSEQHEEEITEIARMTTDGYHDIPIFVCTLAYPTVPCPLHIFEPRYRHMVRQCMESGTRQFGMCVCLADNEDQFADYGCMLEIRGVEYFPDGRSVVDTVGGRRFRVVERSHRDGYHTAKVEFMQDIGAVGEEIEEIKRLHAEVHAEAHDWFSGLPRMHQLRVHRHFGEFPTLEPDVTSLANGPQWTWWVTAVLPLEPRAQLTILAMTSLRERLLAIKRVLKYVRRRDLL